ncbi:MAG TPA: DUF1566 domain-containing protein [bacterium]|jgi:hypothetical protein|nr:DUF1566 domain-containing protein [bacterium]HQB11222.1 DUF1566 domain-containing protein [bacterium]
MIRIYLIVLFVCLFSCDGSGKGNFPYEHNGLYWSDKSPDKMTWDEAVEYCPNLDGRLPTISELRTLIQNCPGTETGGECEVTDSCLAFDCSYGPCGVCEYDQSGKYSVFGDAIWLWSSSERSDNPFHAWYANFENGSVSGYGKISKGSVRCVK